MNLPLYRSHYGTGYIGSFLPYIWLGAEERGLCWFADNDKDWILNIDQKTGMNSPAHLELFRRNGILTLRVNVVQKPVVLQTPRKIVFGMMASPAKPMPKNWRALGRKDHQRMVFCMGGKYLGGAGAYCARYPLNKDFSPFRKFMECRLSGKKLSSEEFDKFFEEWAEKHLTGRATPEIREKYRKWMLMQINRGADYGSDTKVTFYFDEFNSFSSYAEEAPVFYSEWSGNWYDENFRETRKPLADKFNGISMNNFSRSYRDFAAWFGAEWLKNGAGLYWDRAYPKLGNDPVTTSAYRLDNGEIQPSAEIWAMRKYLRRMWILHQQLYDKNAPQYMQLHMTNTLVLPYIVWSDTTLDLEWGQDGNPVFQKKFSSPLLRAESIGRQTGNIPTAFAVCGVRGVTKDEKEIAYRTSFGALMVHDIGQSFSGGVVRHPAKMAAIIRNFGYGLPDCQVYNFWDQSSLLKISDSQCKWLLLRRKDDLLVLLCTWNSKAETVILNLNSQTLKLVPNDAYDPETKEPFDVNGNSISIPLEGYGVRFVQIKCKT